MPPHRLNGFEILETFQQATIVQFAGHVPKINSRLWPKRRMAMAIICILRHGAADNFISLPCSEMASNYGAGIQDVEPDFGNRFWPLDFVREGTAFSRGVSAQFIIFPTGSKPRFNGHVMSLGSPAIYLGLYIFTVFPYPYFNMN